MNFTRNLKLNGVEIRQRKKSIEKRFIDPSLDIMFVLVGNFTNHGQYQCSHHDRFESTKARFHYLCYTVGAKKLYCFSVISFCFDLSEKAFDAKNNEETNN